MKLWIVFFICLSSCTHISQKIHQLPVRVSKSFVLKKLGKPFKVQRKNGQDRWIYKYIIEGRHYTQVVIFKDGKYYKKERMKPYSLRAF